MSRIADQYAKMTAQQGNKINEKARQEAMKFQTFYKADYYKTFRKSIEAQLASMDRELNIKEASDLLIREGKRQALRLILDELDKSEATADRILKTTES